MRHVSCAAQRMYFEGWDVPAGEGGERRYARADAVYETECLDPSVGEFVSSKLTVEDDGKY